MAVIEPIGLTLQTDGIEKGIQKLGELSRQGPKVEQSMSGIASESKRVAKSLADLGVGAGDGLKKAGESAQKAATGLNAAGVAAREAVTDTASLARALAGVTAEEEKFIRKLAEEANGLRLSRGEMEAYRAAQRGMSQGTQEIARAMGARIEAIKAEQVAVSGVNDSFIRLTTVGIQALVGSSLVSYTVRATSAMYEASAAAQRLQTTLNYATGGNGTQEIEKIRQTANKLGLEFQSTAIAYGQFQAAARGTALEGAKAGAVFESVAKASAVLGLSAADTSGVLLALQQMISKGTVQSEELKGQVGERLSGALQTAAKAMGLTTAELGKMLEQGQVVADDFLPKFAAQLENDFGGAAEKAADRLDAATNRMANSWLTLKQVGGDSGVSEFMAGQYAILTDGMNSVSNAMRMAKAEGDGFWGQMLAGGGQVAKFINPMNAFAYSAQEVGNQLSRAEKELAALEAQGAKKSSNLMLREAYAHADRLVSKLREAKIAQDNLAKGGLADAYTEGMGNSKIIPRQRQNAADIDKYLLEDARQTKAQIREEEIGKARKRNAEMVAKAEGDTNSILKLQAALKTEISNIEDKYAEKKSSTKGVDSQAKAVSDIRARILAEEELIKRLQEHGTAAKGLTEADRLVGKLQEEIAGTTNKRTKANLEGQLAEARAWQEAQKTRTELEKQIKAQDEAEKGYRKYIDSLFSTAEALGNVADQQAAANASFGKSKVAIAEMAAEQAKLVALNAKDMGPWTQDQVDALTKIADQHERVVKYLREADYLSANRKYDDGIRAARDELQIQQYSMSLLGEQELKRNKMIAVRKSEIKLARELAEIEKTYMGRNDEASIKQRTDLERKAQIRATEELQVELGQIQERYVTEQVQKYDQIFSQGFADMLNNGKDGWKSFTKSLTTTFKTQVADQIYQMFARPIVVQLVGSLLGMTGGAGGLLGGLLGGGSGGGGGVMGLLSNGSSAYSLYSGEGLLGQGSRYVANMFGFGGAAPWQAAGAQASGAVTMPVTGGLGGAAPGSTSFMGLNGGYAAAGVMMIPLIAAYLGGMFKEERQVGAGITGELGGDLYGYQLMRESGSLFGGPKYRYLVAEKEIEKSKAEIERLKKEIADNPNDARNGYRERQLQQQYSRLEMLSQYDGAIEASKGPIKILQDAFTAMREDTAARADSLKLDGDSIRAMKVTLGIDEIHPDTGGKGLELTGLSQEEAAAKIQAALAQANEEMARSVLGTWQEQTREVTRMVWDNVELPSDGDTQQYGRVGREVTETVTEQVFVMSEYVRAGETAVQALTRLSDSLYSVNTVFDMLGMTLMDTSLAGADLASDIIDAFGGGDKFSAATSNYYDKFYSDQEKVQTQTRLLNEQLKKLGVETMPTSREALREYINGIDLSSEEGRKLYASLLGLVDVFDLIYTSAENIASLKEDLNVQLLRAQGNDAEALRLEREKQIKELEKYNDPELVRMQRDVWAAEDKTKADEEAKQAAETAKDLAMKNLEAAVSREKEYWNQFSADAKDSLTKASSYFDLVTNAAKSLRDSVEDSASWSAAAGMVYIEQALDRARKGGGLSDLDATKSAIEAATGGLVMDNYATQAELDYDKKVLAGQLDELGGYAELAKTDAQKQIDLANAQIKRLDDTLTFWKEYGEEQVDATLSVTDAVNALYKLLDPKEQERIRQEEAEKAGLGGGAATAGKAGSGAALGGTVSGTVGRYVVGFTADGRAKWSDGTVEKYAAGQYQYDGHLLVGSGNLTADQWAAMQAGQSVYGSEWEFDEKQGLWMKRKSFAVGTNYVPHDMTANIHQGERIIPAADNRALMAALNTQGGGNAELVQEVKALRAELQAINHNTGDIAISNRRLDANIDQVSEGGNGLRTVAMN